MTYDSAGRIAKVKNAEGESGAGMQTQWTYSANQLSSITSSGPGWAQPRVQSFKYDAMGRVVETGTGGLSQGEQTTTYRAQTAQGFDAAGRPLWAASSLGIAQQNSYDTESRLLQTSRTSNAMAQTSSNRFDALGRLEATWSHTGQGYALTYNAQGDVQSITDERGRITELAAGPIKLPANPSAKQSNSASQDLTDDFGRLVARISPDSGITTYQHDAADRLVASTDALGNTAQYRFDAAGRITQQVITASARQANLPNQPLITEWLYQGKQLITVKFPTQTEQYSYDARGLKIAKMVSLITSQTAASSTTSAVTRYRYDEAGVLQSTSLPDGSVLMHESNGQGQVVTVKRSELQSPWLQTAWVQRWASWILPAQVIAQDLKRDIVGIKSYTTGNGIQASYQRSQNAALARVSYRNTKPGSAKLQTAANSKLPTLMGRTTQDTISALLGVSPAHAADVPKAAEQTGQTGQATRSTLPGEAGKSTLPGALSLPADPQIFIDHRYLWDTAGNLLLTQGKASTSAYAYDSQDRLIIATQSNGQAIKQVSTSSDINTNTNQTTSRYHYAQGKRVLAQEGVIDAADVQTNTIKAAYQEGSHRWLGGEAVNNPTQSQTSYNANGQPGQAGPRSYNWDALGRLSSVQQNNQPMASYTYNHRGERISKTSQGKRTHYLYEDGHLSVELNEAGDITRQYIYLADMPIAVIDTPKGKSLSNQELAAHTLLGLDLQIIVKSAWSALTNSDTAAETTNWLHTNHLGAPEAATDKTGQLIWQANYAPFGSIIKASLKTKEAFTLNLRLPGQYEDAETGLHYNKQRYYDPARGEYLSPDPLGTPDGPNGYAYVRYNPLKYVDPEGLILFAFDGTGNSNPPPGVDDFSNVYKFFQGYDDAKNGRKWYMNGIGRNDPESSINANSTDPLNGNTGRARVNYMLEQFDNYALDTLKAKPKEKINIDIVGFSRGAAMARDFSNRVATWLGQNRYGVDPTKCVEIRFIGLWDTVAQFGANGFDNNEWQLAIPAQAKNVFQAVALNENRYLFPGESIGRGTQRGFIGSHADIGGSYGTGDLSDVALNWITEQAKNSGITMFDWGLNGTNRAWATVSNPVVHDKSNGTEDSAFCDRVNNGRSTNCNPRRTASPGGLTAAVVIDKNLIIALDKPAMDADGSSRITGDVNMKEYALWLKQNYNLDIAVAP